MVEQKNSGRKDTGRTDKYSDETPRKDYADYRKDYPNDNKAPRREAEDITAGRKKPNFLGPSTFETKKQELIAHTENYQETFSNADKKIWLAKYDELKRAVGI